MFKRLLPFVAVLLLSACAADNGRQVTRTTGEPCHVTCEKCKDKCDCKKNCQCEDCKEGTCTTCKTGDCACKKAKADHKQCKCKDKPAAKSKAPAKPKS